GPVLCLQVVEDLRELRQRRGHGQKAERVARRRGVHHHFLEPVREPPQLDQADQLVHPREREAEERVDVLVVEIGAARGDEPEHPLPGAQPARERPIGVHLGRVQAAPDEAGRRREPLPQGVRERVRRIGRDQQRARPPAREGKRRPGGAGGLSHAALARIEAEHHSCSKFAVASTPTTLSPPGSSPDRWRSRISRSPPRKSFSNPATSSCVISPSSSRIWAASSSSRSRESSFSSASTAAATLSSTTLIPAASILSMISIRLLLLRPLQLEADVDEVVRRPRPRVLEGELVESRADLLHALVE